MTKIFLLMHQYCYEGSALVAAYTTVDAAEAKRSAMLDEGPTYYEYTDTAGRLFTYRGPTHLTTPVKHYKYKPEDLYVDEVELREAL